MLSRAPSMHRSLSDEAGAHHRLGLESLQWVLLVPATTLFKVTSWWDGVTAYTGECADYA